MQIHGPSKVVSNIEVTTYGTGGDVALRVPADISIILQTPDDCEEIIQAAIEAKALLEATS